VEVAESVLQDGSGQDVAGSVVLQRPPHQQHVT